MKTIIEPFRIKVVEPIKMTTKAEREQYIREAKYNPFMLRAEDVLIDLLTDSGTGAMSSSQWAGIMLGDESYAGARSFYNFESAVKEIFGHQFVIPAHQGRAAERLLCHAVIEPGQIIPGNTHFDTTEANIETSGAQPLNIPTPELYDIESDYPFKGNIDLNRLEDTLKKYGKKKIPFVLITITNNSGGGQPVSMANIKGASKLCRKYGVPLLIDAARFAENAYFIKLREEGYSDKSPKEIAKELFSYTDGALMSMKKDAFGNIGGVISINNREWAEKIRNLSILTEGFPTYGGLAGRDLEALAIGIKEILDENYLHYRIKSTEYLGKALDQKGIPVLKPFGGHAIYLDARKFCPHLSDEQLPGWAISVELYIEGGIRSCEIGNVMFGKKLPDGSWQWPKLDLVRLAIPRRVYTQSHIEYVIEAIELVYQRREKIRGLRFTHRPKILPHFTAEFEPL